MFFGFKSLKFHVVSSLILRTGVLHESMCTLLLQAQAGQGKSEKACECAGICTEASCWEKGYTGTSGMAVVTLFLG